MKVYKIAYFIENTKESTVRILEKDFVREHKNHCKIIYKNKIYNLKTDFEIEDKKSEILQIKLLSFYDIPNIDIIITENGQINGYYEQKKYYEKAHKTQVIVRRSHYDISMLVYKINPDEKRVKIFGENFVKNNKDKYFIRYNHKSYELNEYFSINNFYLNIKRINTLNLILIF